MIERLPEPRDYYAGWDSPSPPWPRNVLLFPRQALFAHQGPAHHHRFVLIMAIRGGGMVIVDKTCFRLRAGEAMLIFPFQFHHYARCDENLRWLFITFEMDAAEGLTPLRETPIVLSDRCLRQAAEAAELFLSPGSPPPERRSQLAAVTHILLQELLLTADRNAAAPDEPHAHSESIELFGRIGRYILNHLHEPISVVDVAEHVAYSPSYLRKIFRKQYRLPLVQYIRQNRMIRACRLMETTDLSISQIAGRCGYPSLYSFSRAFKHDLGLSPAAYRRRRERQT